VYIEPVTNNINMDPLAYTLVSLSDIIMKKRVPPTAHSAPIVTATCIHSFLLCGCRLVKIPGIRINAPIIEGINDVGDREADTIETTIPQIIIITP
tara:strand:- start:684 stop:971 length:288 start_codon:yes stop_codon:yes gene_type:complete